MLTVINNYQKSQKLRLPNIGLNNHLICDIQTGKYYSISSCLCNIAKLIPYVRNCKNMAKILQINISANRGSTGKIADGIGRSVLSEGWKSYLAYGGSHRPSESQLISIGGKWNTYTHALQSRLFDNHGLASRCATTRFIEKMRQIKPDIVHLHNIHNYYINYPLLFNFLKETNVPVVWTLHDCWPFTGHCAHFDAIKCEKWKTGCHHCKGLNNYPMSWFADRSKKNYELKKRLFTSIIDRLTIITVSNWIEEFVKESFLNQAKIQTIHNGIDLLTFQPSQSNQIRKKYQIDDQFVILGVASPWNATKGLSDFIKLREILPINKYTIFLVGLSKKEITKLPQNVIGITRTDSPKELAELYSMADVFFNPTYEDNYPTTNLEAIACGTPVITYDTGGCKEAVTGDVGYVVPQEKKKKTVEIISKWQTNGTKNFHLLCRQHAERHFDGSKKFEKYIEIYKSLL